MGEYKKAFDIFLETTPFYVWMWLNKETRYPSQNSNEVGDSTPKLPPPIIEPGEISENDGIEKIVFHCPRNTAYPLPNDQHDHFTLVPMHQYYDKDGIFVEGKETNLAVIRVDLRGLDSNLTQVAGTYLSDFPFFSDYMEKIKDEMIKEFPGFTENTILTSLGNSIKKGPRVETIKNVAKAFFLVNERKYTRTETATLMHTSITSMQKYDPMKDGEGNKQVRDILEFIKSSPEAQDKIMREVVEEMSRNPDKY